MRTVAQEAHASLSGDEGHGLSSRPPKGKRTVVSKYAKHACVQCRNAKARCEGGRPVCARCRKTGHDCVWSAEDARRPLTRARAQALTHQNALLRAEVERLTNELAILRGDSSAAIASSNIGPLTDSASTAHPGAEALHSIGAGRAGLGVVWRLVPLDDVGEANNTDAVSPETYPDDKSHIDADIELNDAATVIEEGDGGNESEVDADMSAYESDGEGGGSDEDDVGTALGAGERTLFTEQDDLYMYGPTSVFRLRRRGRRSGPNAGHGSESGDDSFSSPPESSRNQVPRGRRAKRVRHTNAAPMRHPATVPASSDHTQRHVLFTTSDTGVATRPIINCACEDECWRRYLPSGVPLTREEHDTLLDRFFFFFSSWCMRAIPDFFLRDMYAFLHRPPLHAPSPRSRSSCPPRPTHYSPMLHNALLAVATAFSSIGVIRAEETRGTFAGAAKMLLEQECAAPRIATVQALGMLASYHSGRGEQTLGFMYFGMSVRIAQALGLGTDCTPLLRAGRLRATQVFDRAWAFHAGCAQDACWSLYVGRECGIALPPVSAPISTQCDDKPPVLKARSDRVVGMGKPAAAVRMDDPFCLAAIAARDGIGERLDRMHWRSLRAPAQCGTFTALLWSCQLMKISRRTMDLMNRLTLMDNETEIKVLVTEIDMQLDQWRQDLPQELRLMQSNEHAALPHKLMMHLAFWWQHILLHRPFYQRTSNTRSVDSSFSIARCDAAARSILSTIRLWRRLFDGVFYAPITMVQALFAAGTIFVLQSAHAARANSRRPAPRAEAEARDAAWEMVGALRELAGAWECAKRIADGFERLLRDEGQRLRVSPGEKAGREKVKGRSTTESGSRSAAKRRKINDEQSAAASDAGASVINASAITSPVNVPRLQIPMSANEDSGSGSSEVTSTHIPSAPPHSAISGDSPAPHAHTRTQSHMHAFAFRNRPMHPSVAQVLLSPTVSSDAEGAYYSDIGSSSFKNVLRFESPSAATNNRSPGFLSPKSAFSFSSSGSIPSSSSPSTTAWAWRGNADIGGGYFSDDSYVSDSAAGAASADEGQSVAKLRTSGPITTNHFSTTASSDPSSLNSGLLDLDIDNELRALCGLGESSPSSSAAAAIAFGLGPGPSFDMNMDAAMPGMGLYDPSGLVVGVGMGMNMGTGQSLPALKDATTDSPSSSFLDSFSFLDVPGTGTPYSRIAPDKAYGDGGFLSDADDQAMLDSFFC